MLWQKLHTISNKLHLPSLPNWLLIVLALVLILRVPSFFEPYSYGDEMIYLTLGQGVRQGVTLYKDLYDNKPPLLYLTAALSENLFWFKAILAFWNLATIVLFYKLSLILFEKQKNTQKLATFLFALLTTIPLFEGNTVNAELFMIGPSIGAFLILLSGKLNFRKIFIAGVLFGIATLYKVPALFEAPVIVFYWIITGNLKTEWRSLIKNTLTLISGFILPIALSLTWYFFQGTAGEYVRAAFLQNIGYLSSFRPSDVQKSFIIRNAPLLLRAGFVLMGTALLYLFRKKLTSRFVLLSIWTLFSLFAITLSERPYPHYFIQAVAPVSFFLAILFTEKSFEQSLVVIPLAVSFFVPVYYKFYYYPTTSYYLRFIKLATGKISKQTYFANFGANTSRNYKLADFLASSSSPSDRIFMWDSESPIVYALSRRLPPIKYTVPYHVDDYSNKKAIAAEIIKKQPKFVVLTMGNSIPELSRFVKTKYILVNQIENAGVWARLDPAKFAK